MTLFPNPKKFQVHLFVAIIQSVELPNLSAAFSTYLLGMCMHVCDADELVLSKT
jgi:hypothetical protein